MAKMTNPLKGLTVVDLGVGMAAALTAKYLADVGAEVVRIEPEGGDPFYGVYPAYEVWRRGASKADAGQLDALLAKADAVILGGEDHPALTRRKDAAALAAKNPRLVVLDIEGYPTGSKHAGRPATDLLMQARSGLVWEQIAERPVLMGYEPANYGAALMGLSGLLAALYEREASGLGQVVRTSLFEGAIIWEGIIWADIEKGDPRVKFVMPKQALPLILKCKDGVLIHVVIGGAGSKYGMYQALGIDDPTVTPESISMPQPGGDPRYFMGDLPLLQAHADNFTSDELLERIWSRGLPAEPVLAPGACWDDPQVQLNGIIAKDKDGVRHVGSPLMMDTVAAGAPGKPKSGARPLEGVRVLDYGMFVAGPFASAILADLGCDVIKVETPQGDPNRAVFRSHTVANRGKRAVSIDLKDPKGLAINRALCASADVVTSNFRPGVAARLGIDAKALHASKPETIVLDSPAYGAEGPTALKSGFDMVMQAFCGHEIKAAGEGNPPAWNRNNVVDFGAGMLGTVVTLTALYHRARTGEGASLESPLLNAGVWLISELIQKADGSWDGVTPLAADRDGYTPAESLYQTADGWIAIVARSDAQGAALASVLGAKLGGSVTSWGDAERSAIAAATAKRATDDLLKALEAAGVWVEPCPVTAEADLLQDTDLQKLGTVRVTNHPDYGVIRELGAMIHFSRSKSGSTGHAPRHGEHNAELFSELGLETV